MPSTFYLHAFVKKRPTNRSRKFCKIYVRYKNIARGTTDPWVDTITGGTLQLANLVNRWHHMHLLEIQPPGGATCVSNKFGNQVFHLNQLKIWPTGGATCISQKFGQQVAPLALVRNLANMWLNFQQMHVVPSVY